MLQIVVGTRFGLGCDRYYVSNPITRGIQTVAQENFKKEIKMLRQGKTASAFNNARGSRLCETHVRGDALAESGDIKASPRLNLFFLHS